MDQVLQIVMHATASEKSGKSILGELDHTVASTIKSTLIVVVCQADDALCTTLCSRFVDWFKTNVYPDAKKHTGAIAEALVCGNSSVCLDLILKPILNILLDCSGDAPKLSAKVADNERLWYLNIAANCVRRAGAGLMKYTEKLTQLIQSCVWSDDKLLFSAGFKLARRCMETSLVTTFDDSRCMPVAEWNDPKARKEFVLRWGMPWWSKAMRAEANRGIGEASQHIIWSTPSEEQIQFAYRLLGTSLKLACRFLAKCTPVIPGLVTGLRSDTAGTDITLDELTGKSAEEKTEFFVKMFVPRLKDSKTGGWLELPHDDWPM
eukprot:Lankesteria_metandrocarpae@DN9398_c0_g1_i1.p1